MLNGLQNPMIHTFNKNETVLDGTEYYDIVHSRDHVIVMGDSLGDAGMASGVPSSSHILKIGFLFDHVSVARAWLWTVSLTLFCSPFDSRNWIYLGTWTRSTSCWWTIKRWTSRGRLWTWWRSNRTSELAAIAPSNSTLHSMVAHRFERLSERVAIHHKAIVAGLVTGAPSGLGWLNYTVRYYFTAGNVSQRFQREDKQREFVAFLFQCLWSIFDRKCCWFGSVL